MTNNYKFHSSILVKFGKKNHRFQLASAVDFGGNENEFRVYHNRKWVDGFYTQSGLITLIQSIINPVEEVPNFKRGDRVKWRHKKLDCDVVDMGIVKSEPIQTLQGQFKCLVALYGATELIDCSELEKIER